mgnify:CR=1 FL=1
MPFPARGARIAARFERARRRTPRRRRPRLSPRLFRGAISPDFVDDRAGLSLLTGPVCRFGVAYPSRRFASPARPGTSGKAPGQQVVSSWPLVQRRSPGRRSTLPDVCTFHGSSRCSFRRKRSTESWHPRQTSPNGPWWSFATILPMPRARTRGNSQSKTDILQKAEKEKGQVHAAPVHRHPGDDQERRNPGSAVRGSARTARSCSTDRRSKGSSASKNQTCICDRISRPSASSRGPGPSGEKVARIICDIYTPEGTPFAGLPAHDPEEGDRARRREGLLDEGRARGRVLPVSDQERRPDDGVARRGRLLRSEPRRTWAKTCRREIVLGARSDGISRRSRSPRGGTGPARNRLPLRRCADDGRQHQHVPLRRQERRDSQRAARDVHAEADLRHQRLGHAHPHVALLERRQHLLRRARRLDS